MTERERRHSQDHLSSPSSTEHRAGSGATTASLRPRPSSELPRATAAPVQLREEAAPSHDFERDPFGLGPVQMNGQGADATMAHTQETAARGVVGSGSSLPFMHAIQTSFGGHNVSGIEAHVGGDAASASTAIGAEAYATGNHVAFRNSPDLHTAAHEAAHVIQQRGGVQLKGGVGQAGDEYERNADAVADRVVRGESAEHLLGDPEGAATASVGDVQLKKVDHPDDAPVTHGQLKDAIQRRQLVEWQHESMNLWFARMVDGVDAACSSLVGPKQKKSETLSKLIDLAAMAAIAGGAGVMASAAARHFARGLAGVSKEVAERFTQDSLKELMKKSLTVGSTLRHDMTSDDIVANFKIAQVNKIRHAQIDFHQEVGEGFGEDTWANLPIQDLHRLAQELSVAVRNDEIPHLAAKNTAVEWANLIARMNHGAGGWDPWAGDHGSNHARPTDQAAARPEGIASPVDDPSNSNVDQDSASMRNLVDDDQRKMNPGTKGIIEIDIWGRKKFELFTRSGFGMKLNGVAAHVKDLIADHPTLGDVKMNKLVTIYWDETINPPVPDSRFLITADGYIRSWTTWSNDQLDDAAKFVQGLSPTLIV